MLSHMWVKNLCAVRPSVSIFRPSEFWQRPLYPLTAWAQEIRIRLSFCLSSRTKSLVLAMSLSVSQGVIQLQTVRTLFPSLISILIQVLRTAAARPAACSIQARTFAGSKCLCWLSLALCADLLPLPSS